MSKSVGGNAVIAETFVYAKEKDLIREAILTQHTDGRWGFGEAHEADTGTIDDWLSDVAPGISALAAPELTDAIQDRNGGLPFCITDESAEEGQKTFYIIVWQD